MEPQVSGKPNGALPPEVSTAKNLFQKLAEVVTAIDHVEKGGTNTFQNYKYVKAADIARAVRRELSARNIYLISDVVEIRNYQIPAKEGFMQAVDVKVKFTFVDGDAPAYEEGYNQMTLHAWGTGTDKGDKAVYKAMTGALKYGLRNAFLIPDESDPEADTSVDRAVGSKEAAQAVGKAKVAALKEKMAQRAAQPEPEANAEPAVLFSVLIWKDTDNTANDVYEVSGHSDVMQAHGELLLAHGKKVITGKGDSRKAVVHMNPEKLSDFVFAFEERGGKVKALKPNA